MTDAELARAIAEKAAEQGGTVYFVGGCVRDRLLGLENLAVPFSLQRSAQFSRLSTRSSCVSSVGAYMTTLETAWYSSSMS